MCGIAGLQTAADKLLDERALSAMQASIMHRGPDASGRYASKHTALAVTRLAIVDLETGDQPLFSPEGVVLVANGEIYNAPELRAGYPDYPFATGSDCEAILPLYREHGLDFAQYLRGMYGVALYDDRTGQLVLARDPFGIKPLYYVEGPDYFAFASELSALLDAQLAPRTIDAEAEAELLQLKYVTGDKTISPEIKRLDPGATIVVQNGKVISSRKVPEWPREAAKQKTADRTAHSESMLLKRFTDVISDSVMVHLRADAPSCLFFSGGIDSSILLHVARRVMGKPVEAITIGYAGLAGDESAAAVALAGRSGAPCTRIEMSQEDFWNLAPRIAGVIDDPMADPAVLPLYMLAAEAAKAGRKVALTGEGADEVFGGYSRYRRATLPAILQRKAGRRGVFTNMPVNPARLNGWAEGLNALEAAQTKQWASRLQVLLAIDLLERLPNCLLIKLDRALMAHGVEGRTPFLDKAVIQFATTIPDRLKASPRFGKRLLRDWLAMEFPQARPYARKKTFDVPLESWMAPRQKQLAQLVRGQPGVARIFSADEIDAVFALCERDKQPAWSLLFYALWHSHHILGIDSRGDIGSVLSEAAR